MHVWVCLFVPTIDEGWDGPLVVHVTEENQLPVDKLIVRDVLGLFAIKVELEGEERARVEDHNESSATC